MLLSASGGQRMQRGFEKLAFEAAEQVTATKTLEQKNSDYGTTDHVNRWESSSQKGAVERCNAVPPEL
jgi:hypothetical protein